MNNCLLHAHTKTSFKEHEIITVHGIITMHTLIFLHKVSHFPNSLPLSINKIIPENIPRVGMSFDDSLEWSEKYNNIPYRSTIFHKGPLLAMSSDITDLLSSDPKTSTKINTYKISLNRLLIDNAYNHTF